MSYTAEEEKNLSGKEALEYFKAQVRKYQNQLGCRYNDGYGTKQGYDSSTQKHLAFCKEQLRRVRKDLRAKK